MAGIVRIRIESTWNDWRTQMSRDLAPAADAIYRSEFDDLRMPIREGSQEVICSKDEARARYDWKEGIDVLLYFTDGTKATLQEKFLDYKDDTVTFEEAKTSGKPGAWYYCTAQYYFTGYARKYKSEGLLQFQTYVMVDLPGLHRAAHAGKIQWYFNQNGRDGRLSTFRYVYFQDIPSECIVFQSCRTHTRMPDWEQPALAGWSWPYSSLDY